MGIFDPKVDVNISPEQAVSGGPSGLQVGAGILSNALSAYGNKLRVAAGSGSGGMSAGERTRANDKALMSAYDSGMRKAAALRAQGDSASALRLERTVQTNFAIEGGDVGSDEAKVIYETATGQTYDFVARDENQIATDAIRDTDAYKIQYTTALAQGKEDPDAVALANAAKTEAAQGIRAQADADWDMQGRAAFNQPLLDFDNTVSGQLSSAVANGQVISEDAMGFARGALQEMRSNLMGDANLANLDKEQRDELTVSINRREAALDKLDEYVGIGGVTARDQEAIYKAAQVASQKGELSSEARMLVPSILNGKVDPIISETSKYMEATEFLANTTVPQVTMFDFGQQSDAGITEPKTDAAGVPTYLSDSAVKRADSRNATSNVNLVKGMGTTFSSVDKTDVQSKETYATAAVQLSEEGAASIKKLSNENEHLSKDQLVKTFDGGYVGTLFAVAQQHPEGARTAALQMDYALDSQANVLDVKMDKIASEIPAGTKINDDGKFVVTGDVLINSGQSAQTVARAQTVANELYGGNLQLAMKDGFKKFYAGGKANRNDLALRNLGRDGRGIIRNIEKYNELTDTRNTITGIQDRIAPLYTNGDDVVNNAAPATETANTGRVGNSTTARIMRKFESGSGGYDTLFGQAQAKGGPFEGFNVSEKTLGELYEFANTSNAEGTYGAYVKRTNPKEELATPMGRYQFVGTTLKDTAKKMGLPDNTVFNKETQDRMFLWLANDVISGKSQAGKRQALRSTWDGFSKASDADLNQMIAEIESGNVDLGDGGAGGAFYTETYKDGAITTSPLVAARNAAVSTDTSPVTTEVTVGGTSGGGGASLDVDTDPSGDLTVSDEVAQEGTPSKQTEASDSGTQKLDAKTLQALKKLKLEEYGSVEEVQRAINEGKLGEGDPYVIDGQVKVVEGA